MRNPFRRKTLKYPPDVPPFVQIPFSLIDSGEIKLPTGYAAMYESCAPLQAVIQLVARSLAQTTLRAYLKSPEGPREIHEGGNRLVALLRQAGLAHSIAVDMLVFGEAILLQVGDRWPTELVRLDPSQVDVLGKGSLVTGYRLNADPPFSPDDVLHIRLAPSLTNPLRGLSPLQALRPILQEDAAAHSFRLATWSGATPGTWVERPIESPEWSDTARARFEESLKTRKGSSVVILEEGMKLSTAGGGSTSKDSEYLASRRFVYEQVCAAYGVSASSLSGTSSDRNMDAAHRGLYMDVVAPLGNTICEAIGEQLIPRMFGAQSAGGRIFVAFDISEKMNPSFAQAAEVWSTALAGAAYLTVDEVRSRNGLPAMDDADSLTPVKLRLP